MNLTVLIGNFQNDLMAGGFAPAGQCRAQLHAGAYTPSVLLPTGPQSLLLGWLLRRLH